MLCRDFRDAGGGDVLVQVVEHEDLGLSPSDSDDFVHYCQNTINNNYLCSAYRWVHDVENFELWISMTT